MCDFGWQAGPNRYGLCSGGSCNHSVCEDCKIWNTETVASMRADHEEVQEDVEEEEEAEDGSDSGESSEEHSNEGYSYEGEVEEKGIYGEDNETIDYSLYEPSIDDDSD